MGAGARYGVGQLMLGLLGDAYPWGTLAVNVAGGLAMGVAVGLLARMAAADQLRLFVTVGVLGGFTTFSAFSLELVRMLERGALLLAMGYVFASVIGAALALFCGFALTRGMA